MQFASRIYSTYIVCVRSVRVTALVAVAEDERVRSVLGPHVLELRRIPERLVCELRHADGVRGWAGGAGCETRGLGIIHVCLVVWAVEIFAVPASVESRSRISELLGLVGSYHMVCD